ncbi:hypothetical protein AMTRI_Chr13g89860 [Amborella trichopoda]
MKKEQEIVQDEKEKKDKKKTTTNYEPQTTRKARSRPSSQVKNFSTRPLCSQVLRSTISYMETTHITSKKLQGARVSGCQPKRLPRRWRQAGRLEAAYLMNKHCTTQWQQQIFTLAHSFFVYYHIVFVNDQFLNWDPEHQIKVRIVSARAYHALFMHNMCIRPNAEELENFGTSEFTIYNARQFPCNRYTHYMTSSTSIDLNLARKEMVILVGETKKGLFSVMHYLMLKRGILSLHSGCNMGKGGDVALFFGLSGYFLIGDDEHCWSDNGVSNIEGGCYAKLLENIVFDEHTRKVDYSAKSVTENSRASYPIEYIPNAKIPCVGPHPKNVILLACDAFGFLPPVSKLSLAQTMYHFIIGYTDLVAGIEDGIKEPTATFSACFGAAFIMIHPTKYAAMLAEKMQKHGATGWLVNTSWSRGSYGSGKRVKLRYTKKIIDAIHSGSLLNANYIKTDVFGFEIPTEIEGVPSEILQPMNTWSDKNGYNETLLKLAGLFIKNFEVFTNYKIGEDNSLAKEILAAGPNF